MSTPMNNPNDPEMLKAAHAKQKEIFAKRLKPLEAAFGPEAARMRRDAEKKAAQENLPED